MDKEYGKKCQKIFDYQRKAVDILIAICGIINTDKYPEDVQDDIINLLEQNGINWKEVNQDGSFTTCRGEKNEQCDNNQS